MAATDTFTSLRLPHLFQSKTGNGLRNRARYVSKPGRQQKESILGATPCPHKRMFIFGMGYVGLALARQLQNHGWDVSGTCSRDETRINLEEAGYLAFLFNSVESKKLDEEGLLALRNATHLLASIPPVADFDPVLSLYKEDLLYIARNLNLCWIGYLSSTGVYGDYEGEWVDENSQPKATDKRGIARLMAEKEWLQIGLESGACVQVFRLGGIYGPRRSAINTLLQSGAKSSKQRNRESRQYTSRIHVSDICQVVMASIQSPYPGKIYNVVDDDPASRAEVFDYAESLIAKKWPTMEHLEEHEDLRISLPGEQASSPEKRVLNTRVKEELKVQLIHPSYRSGLQAVIEEMTLPL